MMVVHVSNLSFSCGSFRVLFLSLEWYGLASMCLAVTSFFFLLLGICYWSWIYDLCFSSIMEENSHLSYFHVSLFSFLYFLLSKFFYLYFFLPEFQLDVIPTHHTNLLIWHQYIYFLPIYLFRLHSLDLQFSSS
jgi:hypothetical protein